MVEGVTPGFFAKSAEAIEKRGDGEKSEFVKMRKYKKTKERNLRFLAATEKCAEVTEKDGVKPENRAADEKSVCK